MHRTAQSILSSPAEVTMSHYRLNLKALVVVLTFIFASVSCNLPSIGQKTATPDAARATSVPAATLQPTQPVVENPTPTAVPSPSPEPTSIPPTAVPPPTATPVPVLQPISASNVASLSAVRKWGAGTIRKVELSPDETRLLVASSQGLYLFDSADLQVVWKVVTRFALRDAAFSPDGSVIAAVGDNNGVTLWDATNGQLIKTLFGHSGWIYAVDYSFKGQLASAGEDKTIIIWDVASGNPIHKIKAHTALINSIRFSGDGSTLVSGSADMFVKVWDVAKGTNLQAMTGHMTDILSVDITGGGDIAVSSSSSGEIFVWNALKGVKLYSLKPTGSTTDIRIAPDGMRFAAGFNNGEVMIIRLSDGSEETRLRGHTSLVRSLRFTFVGKQLITGSWDGTVRVWDIPAQEKVGEITGFSAYINDMDASTGPLSLLVAAGNQLRVLDPSTLAVVKAFSAQDAYINAVAITRDGKLAASGGSKDISLWDVASGRETARLIGHLKPVNCLEFSRDGNYLVSGSDDQAVIVWDPASGKEVAKWTGYPSEIYSLLITPDNQYVFVGGRTEAVYIYSLETRKKVTELWLGDNSVFDMLFLANGHLAGASYKKVWTADLETGKLVQQLAGFSDSVNALAVSPDGSLLAAGDYSGKIFLYDTATWQVVKTLDEHWGMIWSIRFSPDGKALFTSGGGDGSVIMWTVQ